MLRLRDFANRGSSSNGPGGGAAARQAQIKIDPKTGFPTVDGVSVLDARPRRGKKGREEEEEQEDAIMEEEEEDEEEEDYGASALASALLPPLSTSLLTHASPPQSPAK